MTRYEKLMDNFEDALFALIMEKTIEEQGERFLEENERLKKQAEFAVPADLDRKISRTINRAFQGEKTERIWRFTGRAVRWAAVIVLAATLLFTTAFAVSESVRTATLNFVSAVFYDHMEIRFVEKDSASDDIRDCPDFEVGWLPEGFELSDRVKTTFDVIEKYKNPNEETIYIEMCSMNENSAYAFDTENAKIEDIYVKGSDAQLIIGEHLQIVIPLAERGEIVSVIGEGEHISVEDMVKIAENIAV